MNQHSREERRDERTSTARHEPDALLDAAAEQLARIFYRQIIESDDPTTSKQDPT
jgi:hypothetical protein